MGPTQKESEIIPARLGLWDAVSMVVGIIIGVGIFETPYRVFREVPDGLLVIGVWALGGLLALVGALCFGELASTYPRSGGEYVYLTRAFGPWVGYLFAWAQLGVIRTSGIAALGYVFASYAGRLWDLDSTAVIIWAAVPIALLAFINILGVTLGTQTQNLLTVLKVLGMASIVLAGFLWTPAQSHAVVEEAPTGWFGEALAEGVQAGVEGAGFRLPGWFALSMIMVLWTYAGWHEAAYVAAEVKNPRRNLPLALILGTAAVTVIYLLVNGAFLLGLGLHDARADTMAGDLFKRAWGGWGGRIFHLLVMVSALGAINGMIFTTSRICTELGTDHRLFAPLSRWSRRWGTPVHSLIVVGVISLLMALGAGIWFEGKKGFDALVYFTGAVFWLFFLLTGVSLFLLRWKDRTLERPFPVPGYPVVPILFCLWCAYMVYGAIRYKPQESFLGLAILLLGIPFYFIPQKLKKSRGRPSQAAETETLAEQS